MFVNAANEVACTPVNPLPSPVIVVALTEPAVTFPTVKPANSGDAVFATDCGNEMIPVEETSTPSPALMPNFEALILVAGEISSF